MNLVLLIALGGGIGSVLRHYSILFFGSIFGVSFPFGTIFVNVLGSFLIGLVVEIVAQRLAASSSIQLFLITGVLGGFTTFSAFSLDIFKLMQGGQTLLAIGYALLSVVVSFLALLGGVFIVRGIII